MVAKIFSLNTELSFLILSMLTFMFELAVEFNFLPKISCLVNWSSVNAIRLIGVVNFNALFYTPSSSACLPGMFILTSVDVYYFTVVIKLETSSSSLEQVPSLNIALKFFLHLGWVVVVAVFPNESHDY